MAPVAVVASVGRMLPLVSSSAADATTQFRIYQRHATLECACQAVVHAMPAGAPSWVAIFIHVAIFFVLQLRR